MNKLALSAAAVALLTSIGARAAGDSDFLGTVVPPEDAARTVVIQPRTKFVNVTHGEVVRFVDNGREFAIRFDGIRSEYDLNAVAPAGAVDHEVKVYVQKDVADFD